MRAKSSQRRRPGYALMVVVVQVMLLTALWGVAYRQLSSTIRFIEFLEPGGQDASAQVGLKALTRALILLETGDPPDGYSCIVAIPVYKRPPAYFVVTFTLDGGGPPGGTRWKVQSARVDDPTSYQLPSMPYTFPPP